MIYLTNGKNKEQAKAAADKIRAENAANLQRLVDAGRVNVQPTAEDLADLDELERFEEQELGGEG